MGENKRFSKCRTHNAFWGFEKSRTKRLCRQMSSIIVSSFKSIEKLPRDEDLEIDWETGSYSAPLGEIKNPARSNFADWRLVTFYHFSDQSNKYIGTRSISNLGEGAPHSAPETISKNAAQGDCVIWLLGSSCHVSNRSDENCKRKKCQMVTDELTPGQTDGRTPRPISSGQLRLPLKTSDIGLMASLFFLNIEECKHQLILKL